MIAAASDGIIADGDDTLGPAAARRHLDAALGLAEDPDDERLALENLAK